MRILQGSCKELFKDLPKIFIRILKDPQWSYEVLKKILRGAYQRSLSGSLRILKDMTRILQGSCKELFKDLPKIFIRIVKDPQGSYEVLKKILRGSYKSSLSGSLRI